MEDLYNVKKYTDIELYNILDINNPTDRELEAKILYFVNKYSNIGGPDGEKLAQFFIDIYCHFFEDENNEDKLIEGIDTTTSMANTSAQQTTNGNADTQQNNQSSQNQNSQNQNQSSRNISSTESSNQNSSQQQSQQQQTGNSGTGDTKKKEPTDNIALTKTLDYSKDKLNPLLKQTIKRVISIDSQYRVNKSTSTTEFTFNLSDPLKDVVSLRLYSVQIPYTWYVVNNSFGGNFFYIKGNSPGIDNPYHDIQISINSGNYTPQTLVTAINNNISIIKNIYTDVSFGTTAVYYNTSPVTFQELTHGRASLRIDLKKTFNQSNYYLNFPTWSSITGNYTDPNNPITPDFTRSETIPSYLGFNNTKYSCSAIYSARSLPLSTDTGEQTNLFYYDIIDENKTITIVSYTGSSYSSMSASNDIIYVTLDIGTYTRATLISHIDLKLKTNTYLDSQYSYAKWIDISNIFQQDVGHSYIEMGIKLNRFNTTNLSGLKTAIIFPQETSVLPVWVGSNSCLAFLSYINELNTIVAETKTIQTDYPITGTNQIRFQCILPGYDVSTNDYIVDLPTSQAAGYPIGYTLNNYIYGINQAILQANQIYSLSKSKTDLYGIIGKRSYFEYSADDYIRYYSFINRVFTQEHYVIEASGVLCDIFGMEPGIKYDMSSNNIFISTNFDFTSITFGAFSNDILTITPKNNGYGNEMANPYIIDFSNVEVSYDSIQNIVTYMNERITLFLDNRNRHILGLSSVIYRTQDPNIIERTSGFLLTINLQNQLTQDDYKMTFYSTMNTNSWTTNLYFDQSYNIGNYSYIILDPSATIPVPYNTIRNNQKKNDNTIELLDGANNSFSINTFNVNGIYTTTGEYNIQITLTPGVYSRSQLITSINNILTANPLSIGSEMFVVQKDGFDYTAFKFVINKNFGTSDYRLVFYDPYSFVSCNTSSKGGSRSVQNTTWDTTIGWLLGFRENIIYYLTDYTPISYYYGITDFIFYLTGDNANVCCLTGDTTVNTNLYSYFLIILDDYVQNHLNDGLVTITPQETSILVPPTKQICDPTTGELTSVPADYNEKSYTQKELYAYNQKVQSQKVKVKSYSKGPFIKDIFGLIPMKTTGLSTGAVYVEFGGTLQNQERVYFGPVNIHRMTIKLMNDRGDLVDLNGSNWSFSLVCEQLYKT